MYKIYFALIYCCQVHVFDKNADETISWISEKEAEISTDELGQDLETIQSLLERQQGFQRDLAAIQQQVIWRLWKRKQRCSANCSPTLQLT